jgi:hypothetical protein
MWNQKLKTWEKVLKKNADKYLHKFWFLVQQNQFDGQHKYHWTIGTRPAHLVDLVIK